MFGKTQKNNLIIVSFPLSLILNLMSKYFELPIICSFDVSRDIYLYEYTYIYLCSGNLNSWKTLMASFLFSLLFSQKQTSSPSLTYFRSMHMHTSMITEGDSRFYLRHKKEYKLLPKAMIRLNKSFFFSDEYNHLYNSNNWNKIIFKRDIDRLDIYF